MAMDHELLNLITEMKESLEREVQSGFEKMEHRFEKMEHRFDQMNARLVRVDSVWKVARDWGRSVDEHDIQSDRVIANLVRQVASFEERLSKIEKDKKQ
jgi:hypothetical protein